MVAGLAELAERAARSAQYIGRRKRSKAETHDRLVAALMPVILEAVEIGLDQSIIAVRNDVAAVLAIDAIKRAVRAQLSNREKYNG